MAASSSSSDAVDDPPLVREKDIEQLEWEVLMLKKEKHGKRNLVNEMSKNAERVKRDIERYLASYRKDAEELADVHAQRMVTAAIAAQAAVENSETFFGVHSALKHINEADAIMRSMFAKKSKIEELQRDSDKAFEHWNKYTVQYNAIDAQLKDKLAELESAKSLRRQQQTTMPRDERVAYAKKLQKTELNAIDDKLNRIEDILTMSELLTKKKMDAYNCAEAARKAAIQAKNMYEQLKIRAEYDIVAAGGAKLHYHDMQWYNDKETADEKLKNAGTWLGVAETNLMTHNAFISDAEKTRRELLNYLERVNFFELGSLLESENRPSPDIMNALKNIEQSAKDEIDAVVRLARSPILRDCEGGDSAAFENTREQRTTEVTRLEHQAREAIRKYQRKIDRHLD